VRRLLPLPLLVALFPTLSAASGGGEWATAQEGVAQAPLVPRATPPPPPAPDTLLRELLPPASRLDPGPVPASARRISLGLAEVPLPLPVTFPPSPGEARSWIVPPGEGPAWRGLRRLEARVAAGPRVPPPVRAGEDTAAVRTDFLPPLPPARAAAPEPIPGADHLPDFFSEYTDLGIRLRGRTELGGDWTRFRPCDTGALFSCDASLIPQLKPEVQFGLQVAGTVSDRVVVNVDYDQTREFSAANNINIYYQGLEDEILQRLEVGDVTFSLPESRFLTEGIPAGNFGLRATGQVGPLEFQTVFAQQRGDLSSREFRISGVGGTQGFVQEDTLVVDDADYVRRQFFFLLAPKLLPAYPHIDVLDLAPGSAPPGSRPGADAIQLYRFENEPVTQQQVEGYIQADAVAEGEGEVLRESGWFRYLQPGVDYFLHPSGLWVALRSPLRNEEMLAVTFITAAGDTVGDYNPERLHNAGVRPTLRLLKGSGPNHQPGRPTWELEMHQVYRISGSNDVEIPSVELAISLGELSAGRTFKRGLTGEEITFLKLFGVDEEAPADQLDRAYIYRPAEDILQDQPPVSGTFIVFPTLRPFARPPPLPSLNLSADETAAILAEDRNQRIYDDPDPVNRANGGLYRLTIPFRVRSDGLVSSFSLGALGIRDGSERIVLGDRILQSGQDYLIDYDLGMVTLLDAQALFAAAPGGDLRATWEQKSIFQIAPTSVLGISSRYRLGTVGELNFLGLYQSEQALVNRPQLGVEPSAILLGGMNGRLEVEAGWLDRALESVPGLRAEGSSSVRMQGELALSLPNPNTRGDVFLDDFDGTADISLSPLAPAWRLGSRPDFRDGAEARLPLSLEADNIGRMVWQHSWVQESPASDSVGIFEGFLPENIDRQINVAGSATREPVLLVTFGAGQSQPFGERRWRSMTTVLSTTGLDLTRSEFLEVYVAQGEAATLIFDLGRVSEDAFFVDAQGRTSGVKPNGEPWGLGILDAEANLRVGEIWSDEADARGVWGESCVAERGGVSRVGDPRANCTRGNGRPDSEDLDGNGNLDTEERYTRFVLELDGSSPYLARDVRETGTLFRLYRIPLRGAGGINPGGGFTEADWRSVKHLRVTMAADRPQALILARMRLTGSRWVKRSVDGVLEGISGEVRGGIGSVEVTSVSRLTEGGAYQPPPGVLEQLDDPTSAFSGRGVEFNEKSLGLRYREVGGGERVEVYSRFPQRPRNFLNYRQARLWVVAREGDWGVDRPLSFFMKVGSDPDNFYLYRTRLERVPDPAAVSPGDWLPEVVVDFDEWLDLRSRAEELLIAEPPSPGDSPLVLWSADSTHAIVIRDRARAPSLASVRELSLGVWNEGEFVTSGEVWINEFRLSQGVTDPGYAGYMNLDIVGGDVMTTRVSMTNRGPFFRQLRGESTYLDDRELAVNSTLQLSRFTPTGWGIDLPLTVTHARTGQDPTFLARSDIRADRLQGLRDTGGSRTRVGLAFRKRTPTANPLLGVVLDGLDARVGWSAARTGTLTSVAESDAVDGRLGYSRPLDRRDLPVVPELLGPVVSVLPEFLERRLREARLRWSPERVGWSAAYFRQENRAFRYDQVLVLPGDGAILPTRSPRQGLEHSAEVAFRPIQALTAELNFLANRDLLDPEVATQDVGLRPILEAERRRLAGMDLGWETNRNLRSRLGFHPRLAAWLRTDLTVTTQYLSDRNAGYVRRTIQVEGDTLRELQRNASGQRDVVAVVAVEPAALVRGALGEAQPGEGAAVRFLRGMGTRVLPLSVTRQEGITSRFNREVVSPGRDFQFGWVGMDEYRVIDGDTAATLTDRTAWSGGSGVRFPGGITVNVDYAESRSSTLDARNDRDLLTRSWPNTRVGIPDLPLPGRIRPVVQRVSLTSGYVVQSTESTFGAQAAQLRTREDRILPFSVSVRWGGALNTAYSVNLQRGEGVDPTGDTERSRQVHNVTVSSSFRPPGEIRERLERPIQIALRMGYTDQLDCRTTAGRDVCTPYVDQLTRDLNLTVDTNVSGLEVGMRASFFDRQSFIGQRTGSTQFQLGVFAQFLFSAGSMAPMGGIR